MKTVFRNLSIIVLTLTASVFSLNKIAAQTTTSLTSGGTASSVAASGSPTPVAWTNATSTRLSTNDDSRTTVSLGSGTSQYLNVTNFGFSIPSNAIILGVTVQVRRLQNSTSNTSITDNNVQLINNAGALIGSDLSDGNEWATAEELITYGGSSNTWGLSTLTPTMINSSSFGFSLRAQCGTSGRTGEIDQVQMSVTYYVPSYFKSRQTGNFSTMSTWSQSSDGTTWVNATATPSVNDLTVSIENGHTVTVSSNVTSDQVTINSGGRVNVSSGQTWTINNGSGTDLNVSGIISNAGTITNNGLINFGASSEYIHNMNGGTIPASTWNVSSTCTLSGIVATAPAGLTQNFGNLTLNNAGQTVQIDPGAALSIQANFSILNLGSGSFKFNNDEANVIGGNYVQSAGSVFLGNNNAHSLTISGNFTLSSGTFTQTGTTDGQLFVAGDFTHSGGTLTETGNPLIITFNGGTIQTFTSGGTVSNDIRYVVNSGSTLKMADESTVVNGTTFTLNSDATLDIKSANGITTSATGTGATAGNIRTTTRTFNVAANYIYSGAGQAVGNALLGARNLTLSGSGTKTFATANFTTVSNTTLGVTADLNIGSGVVLAIPAAKIIEVSSKLYIAGVGKVNGSYGSTSSSATYKDNTYFTATTGRVNSAISALPVTLSSFTAKPTPDNKVSLGWVTSTEQVNKGFRIERQAGIDNGKYEQIGFVGSKAKDGNSQNTLYYSFIDAAPKTGVASLYRLVQEDLDGKLTYSEVRVVKLNGQSVSLVFPNPSNGAVNISRTADGKKMNIQVIDQSGRIISQVNNITDANYRMNLPQSGIYSIKMMYPETGEQSIQRVVVQK